MADKKQAETPEDEAPDGGRKKLLVIGVAALLAVAGAAYFLFASSSDAEAAEPVSGGYVALEPIAVNLAGGGYLKVGITLEITEAAATVDGSKALDLLISTYSQAQPADVVGARDALKEALEQKIVEAYTDQGTPMVMGIYLTEYVTQ